MEKKVILVTGASDGIGKETAKTLAKQGHIVIVHGRNPQKTQAAYEEIKAESGNDKVEYMTADFLSLAEIRRFADNIKQKYDRLDVLVNNAGAIFGKIRETTADGLEKTITLNLFAPFLLTELLLDVLAKSPSSRIINLSSAMHKRGGKPDFNDFQLEKTYKATRAYGLSKLYLIWITRHLAAELKERGITNITVNASHPGAVVTNFGRNADKGFLINLIFKLASYVMDKPEKGAMTSIYLATSPEVEGITGKFFGNREKEEKADDKYYSVENEKTVWDYCMNIVKTYLVNP